MKFMMFLAFFYLASVAQAAEVTVLESKLTNTLASAFKTTKQPLRVIPGPGWNVRHGMPRQIPTVIYQNKIATEGLILIGDKLIYQDVSQ